MGSFMAFVTNSFEKSTSEVVVSVEQTPEYQPVGVWDCSAKTIHHHMASLHEYRYPTHDIFTIGTVSIQKWSCCYTEIAIIMMDGRDLEVIPVQEFPADVDTLFR